VRGWPTLLLVALVGAAGLLVAQTTGKHSVMQEDIGVYNAALSAPGTLSSATLTQAASDITSRCGTKCALFLTQGSWSLTTNHTITQPVVIPYGTRVTIASGMTLTLQACPKIDQPLWLQPGTTGKVNITASGCPIEVAKMATGGSGTQATPWTGWDTALIWNAMTTYRFRTGYYSYATSPAWGLNGLGLIGDDRATLLYTGNGNAMTFDGRGDADGGKHNIRVENLTISGNAAALRGIYFTHIFRSVVRNVRIRNISQTAFGCEYCVLVTLDNVGFTSTQESTDEVANTVFPTTGLLLDWNASDTTGGCPCYSSANTLINTMWENVHGPGMYVGHAFNTYSLGGTSEHNYYGIQTTGAAQFNIFANMDVEQNVTPTPTGNAVVDAQDIDENGDSNQYIGLFGGATVHVNAGSYGMQILGGRYSDFVISGTAASLFMSGTVLRHCLASTTPKAPNIRLINVWVSNPQAVPPLHVPHDTWCAGNNNQQMWSSAGNTMVENLVVKPQSLDFSTLAYPPLYNTPALDVVGQSWSQAAASPDSRKGIVQLYNKDNVQQYFYMGIDGAAGPAGKGQVYLGGWNGAGGAYPMQGVWGTGSPSALRISTVTAGTINGVDAEAGALIWCSDCTKATDPCTGSGNGAYAYKTTIATWRCP